MSFNRFKRGNKSKTGSVQSKEDYQEQINQPDNLSQNQQTNEQQMHNVSQGLKGQLNEDREASKKNSVSGSSTSEGDQYICDNCINEALMYSKDRPKDDIYHSQESPMDVQDRLNALQRKQIEERVRQRQMFADEVSKNLNQLTDKELLQKQNEKGSFFKDDDDLQRMRVLDNYNRIQDLNAKTQKGMTSKDQYYKSYVDNYKPDYYGEYDEDVENRRNMQMKYNKELHDQIELNRKLKERQNAENRKQGYYDDGFEKDLEDEERRRRLKNDEINRFNKNLIDQRNKRRMNDKLNDEYNERKNADELQNKYNYEAMKEKEIDEGRKKEWQRTLQEQIDNKNKRIKDEKERDRYLYGRNFDDVCECDPNGRCCCCKRIYPIAVLNPRKKYAALVRIQKARKAKQAQQAFV